MGLLSKSHKNMAESTAAKVAPNATAAGVPVLILWASEKFTQGRQSGCTRRAARSGSDPTTTTSLPTESL